MGVLTVVNILVMLKAVKVFKRDRGMVIAAGLAKPGEAIIEIPAERFMQPPETRVPDRAPRVFRQKTDAEISAVQRRRRGEPATTKEMERLVEEAAAEGLDEMQWQRGVGA